MLSITTDLSFNLIIIEGNYTTKVDISNRGNGNIAVASICRINETHEKQEFKEISEWPKVNRMICAFS